MPSSSGSRGTARSSPASTASTSRSPMPATCGSNGCGGKMDTTPRATRPAAAELEPPAPTTRRLAEASISPNTRRTYLRGAPPPQRLARRPAARGHRPGRVPRRTPRTGPSAGEHDDGGSRGVVQDPPRRQPDPGRETDSPGPRRLGTAAAVTCPMGVGQARADRDAVRRGGERYTLAHALGNDLGRFQALVGRWVGGGEVVTE